MTGPCKDLIVLDFSWGMTGAIATMVLADYGAEVIKVEPPAGDPFRSHPGWLAWNRGKQGIVLDLKSAEGREQALRLAERADVVVESFRPGVAKRLGIDYATLSRINPRLVYCSITGFGQQGPLSGVKGYEGVVAAKSGRMMTFAGQTKRSGPVFSAVQVGSWASSQAAVWGILSALINRDHLGHGQWVQASLLQGMIPYDFQGLVMGQFRSRYPDKFPVDPVAALMQVPTLMYLPARTKDGHWIQLANQMPRLFQSFIRTIGLWHIYQDERFETAPTLTVENREILRDMILDKMLEKTLDEWMKIFIEDGDVAAEPFLPTREGMNHPQFVHNQHAVEVNDPRVGPMKQLGLLIHLADTPGEIGGPAPDLGQHTATVLARLATQPKVPAPMAGASNDGPNAQVRRKPLEGITVLDLATVIAGPYGAAMLADLGARVIKVEQPPDGDPLRIMGGSFGVTAIKTTAGKESIEVDLKFEQGQEIMHKLIAQADVLLHNYRPGVPERLSIDYNTCKQINPRLIYIYSGGYGATGPHSRRPSFHPLPGALLGGALTQAGRAMPPSPDTPLTRDELKEVSRWLFRANEGNPDPNSSMAVATGIMLGLYARERTGKGQFVQATMIGANAYANADEAFDYAGRPPRPLPDADCHGLNALYRLYQAKDSWVFLACLFDEEWEAFCRIAGQDGLLADPRFQTAAARQTHDEELAALLAQVLVTRGASEWETLLTAADVACVQADVTAGDFFSTHPHARENGFVVQAQPDHSRFGDFTRYSGLVQFSDMELGRGPGANGGEHTRPLLKELGYTDEQIEALWAIGVVYGEEPNPVNV